MAEERLYSRDILLILGASFFYFSCPMLVTPIITGFSGSLGASAALMGLIGGMMNLCSLFCRPFAGNLADKIDKSRLSIAGTWMMAAACLGYMLALDACVVAAFRVLHGVGFACCSVCMATWMSNLLPRDKIGSGMGLYGAMNALAMALAPALGIFTYRLFGYRAAFGVAMLFALVSSFTIMFIKKGGAPENRAKPADARRGGGFSFIYVKVVPAALIIMLFAIPYCYYKQGGFQCPPLLNDLIDGAIIGTPHLEIVNTVKAKVPVVLMDVPFSMDFVDVPMVNMLEQKLEKTRFTRVDADVIDRLIVKEEQKGEELPDDKRQMLTTVFNGQLPKLQKTEFHVETQPMGEANIQAGMSFYGEMPNMYNVVLNSDHKLVKQVLDDAESACCEQLAPINEELASMKLREDELHKAHEGKKDEEIPTAEKDELKDLDKKMNEKKQQKTDIIGTYAASNKIVHQLIDLALLQNGMLKGEALTNFVKRSIELI